MVVYTMSGDQERLPATGEGQGNKGALKARVGPRHNASARLPRRKFFTLAGAAALAAPCLVRAGADAPPVREQESKMEIKRVGSEPSAKGPAEYFTGTVRVDPLFKAAAPARSAGASVTFEPGARTAWHTHPLGQTLIVTAGCGWAQVEGGPVEEIRPGDVVWFPPAVKHWHGAAATTAVTHIAIQEQLDGKAVDWLEKVTDAQYQAPKGRR
jgi:quercetin dioxygenase-like cupin family protein